MTLAAWIIMIVASCAFGCSCLGGGGGGGGRKKRAKDEYESGGAYGNRKDNYAEQMRMDALAAEQDRKRRQDAYGRNRTESDLPKFAEYETEHEVAVPLTSNYDDGHQYYNHGNGSAVAYQPYQNNGYGNGHQSSPYNVAPVPAPSRQKSSVTTHVPGVGNGYGRRDNNAAGQGAHAGANAILYDPRGNGPQPYRDPPASNVSHSQTYQDYGHQAEYSGQTFGNNQNLDYERRAPSVAPSMQSGIQGAGGAYRAPSTSNHHHQQYSSYDQYNQQSIPPMPIPSNSHANANANYGLNRAPSTAPTEVPLSPRREPTVDDGFGLAVLTAGAAAAAAAKQKAEEDQNQHQQIVSSPLDEEDYRYGNQASSAYGHGAYDDRDRQRNGNGNGNDQRSRQPLPSIPTQQDSYYDDQHQQPESSHNHSAPPEYDWDHGNVTNGSTSYGQTPNTRSSYPVEKR